MINCFPKRDDWIKQTIFEMQRHFWGRILGDVHAWDDGRRIVTVYGHPQVGKTTLILELMGIKEDCQERVHKVLRAGRLKGDSSTSTVIIYKFSQNEKWGISYKRAGVKTNEGIKEYNSDSEFENELKEIRNRVERGNKTWDNISIYIPESFFVSIDRNSGLNIVDLPGIGSRNLDESTHVNGIIEDYVIHSSVTIIVWEAHKIDSLADEKVPGASWWPSMGRKFILVLTRAYSQASIRRKISEDVSFSEIRNVYRSELERVFPSIFDNDLEFFLVDMGNSLQGEPEPQRGLIRNTVQNELESIREAIFDRDGNALLSSIQMEKAMVERECLKNRNQIETDINEIRISRQKHEEERGRLQKELDRFSGLDDINSGGSVLDDSKIRIQFFREWLKGEDESFYAVRDRFIQSYDSVKYSKGSVKKGEIDSIINGYESIEDKARETIRCDFIKKYKEGGDCASVTRHVNCSENNAEEIGFDQTVFDRIDENIPDDTFWSEIKGDLEHMIENRFIKRCKRSVVGDTVFTRLGDRFDKICKNISKDLQSVLKDVELEKRRIEDKKAARKEIINQIEVENYRIGKLVMTQNELEDDKKVNEERLEMIKEYLDVYYRVVNEQYKKQKEEIKHIMASSEVGSMERMELLFLLGLMESDYNKLVVDRSV